MVWQYILYQFLAIYWEDLILFWLHKFIKGKRFNITNCFTCYDRTQSIRHFNNSFIPHVEKLKFSFLRIIDNGFSIISKYVCLRTWYHIMRNERRLSNINYHKIWFGVRRIVKYVVKYLARIAEIFAYMSPLRRRCNCRKTKV